MDQMYIEYILSAMKRNGGSSHLGYSWLTSHFAIPNLLGPSYNKTDHGY